MALLMALLMASIPAFGAFFAGAAPIRAAQDQTPQSHSTAAEESSPSQRFAQLIAAHDEWRLTVFPEYALRRGIDTRAGELTDSSLAGAYKRNAWIENFMIEVRALDASTLSAADARDYFLLRRDLELSLEGFRFGAWMMPVSGRNGPHQDIAQMGDLATFTDLNDYDAYINRLLGVPGSLLGTMEVMRAGIEAGLLPPKVTVEQVPLQIRAARTSLPDALRKPFNTMPKTITPADRERLLRDFERTLEPIDIVLTEFEAFFINDYLPKCRASIAASDMQNGAAFYAHQLKVHTTTALSAQEIHATGLSEVARIRAEMMTVIAKTDWYSADPARAKLPEDERFAAFVRFLRSDPRFYCKTSAELLARYRDVCKRIDPKLPALFATCPRLTYGVREIPRFMAPAQTTAYYQPGSPQLGEPGYFYANTYALDQRPTYEFIPLTLHEAVPGHHFQIALAQELTSARAFRKDLDSTAFTEGWALYAERLGIEMGFFEDPYDDFGRLLYEMWRACRLVVDPGMHALGWSRERAIDFLKQNTALSELNIVNEVDRYIGWPGQACGYKIGELTIRRLRAAAEKTLGAKFDLRRFHDAVLLDGPVPLDLLERNINEWIAAEERRIAAQG
jgi:uncharacterized protein (DUF885 family)